LRATSKRRVSGNDEKHPTIFKGLVAQSSSSTSNPRVEICSWKFATRRSFTADLLGRHEIMKLHDKSAGSTTLCLVLRSS